MNRDKQCKLCKKPLNGEYMANLIKAFSKYPEYSLFTYDLVKTILGKTLKE